jgi:hypothetical protein
VLVSYADGCITQACIAAGVNDFTSKAVIARQSGGTAFISSSIPRNRPCPRLRACPASAPLPEWSG